MARKKETHRVLSWCQISSADGADLGSFAIDGDSMIVESNAGWTKTVRAGPSVAWAGLALMVVSEPPPPSFRRS